MSYPSDPTADAAALPVRLAKNTVASRGVAHGPFSISAIPSGQNNAYVQIWPAGGCLNGGVIENTSGEPSGSGGVILYLDYTSNAVLGQTTLGSGALLLGPAAVANQAGGKMTIPPTANAGFVYGAVGTTFRGNVG